MREQNKSKKWDWAARLTRWRLKRTNEGKSLSDSPKDKVLTMENTVATKLTDFYPTILKPDGQQDLVDWKALEPRPVTAPDRYTGLQNWPRGDEE